MTKIYAGMKLKLIDADDGGTFNTIQVAPTPGQTVEAAYHNAVKQLEIKRNGWQKVYPNCSFQIKAA